MSQTRCACSCGCENKTENGLCDDCKNGRCLDPRE